ncbi:DUF4349 domain-containing protein [Chryseobacterium lactis]|uniref:DUF4349 domain-containing protein n=1 Tax=Chryseobacterium lactis TaxID=1241981 RepID=A0A3G6REB9_CHRLC|nr:DUF4349 domain-containing protein [Chryseobacterium lactis]AZA83009.1 DUF4349 domain-containing protein [Chryseobacterium lactis]AZB03392.1 DUF4349 domain-containing protein [Chryseobacterium lactis]PNW12322.1 DUF4349 domain-containing protein [Chryseobacterium lactis]
MRTLLLPLFFITLINCSKSGGEKYSADAAVSEIITEDKALPPPSSISEKLADNKASPNSEMKTDTISRKIIKNGDMRIQVGEIKKAQAQANEILKKNNAYIQKEEFQNSDLDENLNLTIRVPHKNFDALVNSFSDGIGSVLSKNISSDDVTEEYTDISIKLANKKLYLEKYRDMLKGAATTKDMLEIQEKIRGLEDEIDVAEGRLRFIDDRVNYSTLNLNLYKEKVRSSATSKIGFGSRFIDSVTEGWNSFVSFMLGLISLWPFFLLIPVLVFLWRKWKSRRKK